jgi:hypothetical protein
MKRNRFDVKKNKVKKRICNLSKDFSEKCSHLWGSECNYKCCRKCPEINCNSRCGWSRPAIIKIINRRE